MKIGNEWQLANGCLLLALLSQYLRVHLAHYEHFEIK